MRIVRAAYLSPKYLASESEMSAAEACAGIRITAADAQPEKRYGQMKMAIATSTTAAADAAAISFLWLRRAIFPCRGLWSVFEVIDYA